MKRAPRPGRGVRAPGERLAMYIGVWWSSPSSSLVDATRLYASPSCTLTPYVALRYVRMRICGVPWSHVVTAHMKADVSRQLRDHHFWPYSRSRRAAESFISRAQS